MDENRILPGKDDNFLTFYSDQSANIVTYPAFYYAVDWVVAGNQIHQVFQPLGRYEDNTFVPIKVNIRDIVEKYLTETEENTCAEPLQYFTGKIATISFLRIRGCYITSGGETTIDEVLAINNNPVYFYDGESFSFWNQKNNSGTATGYLGTADKPGTWIGSFKPNSLTNMTPSIFSGALLSSYYKREAYDIDTTSNRTASTFFLKRSGQQIVTNYTFARLAVYDKKGRISRFGVLNLDYLLQTMDKSILTVPVGIPQLNDIMVLSATPVSNRFAMQYYVYDGVIPELEISPEQDSYYQIWLGNYYPNAQIRTVPLTFRITPVCKKDSELEYDFSDISDINVLYYSRMGGWWQIPLYSRRNRRKVSVKNVIRNSAVVSKNIFDRNKHVVTTTSDDKYLVNTGWLTDRECLEVEDMLESPVLWLVSGQKYIPVVISSAEVEIDTNTGIKSYSFEFENGYYKNTIA